MDQERSTARSRTQRVIRGAVFIATIPAILVLALLEKIIGERRLMRIEKWLEETFSDG